MTIKLTIEKTLAVIELKLFIFCVKSTRVGTTRLFVIYDSMGALLANFHIIGIIAG